MTFNTPGYCFTRGEGIIADSELDSKKNAQPSRGSLDPLRHSVQTI